MTAFPASACYLQQAASASRTLDVLGEGCRFAIGAGRRALAEGRTADAARWEAMAFDYVVRMRNAVARRSWATAQAAALAA